MTLKLSSYRERNCTLVPAKIKMRLPLVGNDGQVQSTTSYNAVAQTQVIILILSLAESFVRIRVASWETMIFWRPWHSYMFFFNSCEWTWPHQQVFVTSLTYGFLLWKINRKLIGMSHRKPVHRIFPIKHPVWNSLSIRNKRPLR